MIWESGPHKFIDNQKWASRHKRLRAPALGWKQSKTQIQNTDLKQRKSVNSHILQTEYKPMNNQYLSVFMLKLLINHQNNFLWID